MARAFRSVAFLCLFVWPAFSAAQMGTYNYSTSNTFTLVNNIPNCSGGLCWHATLKAPEIFSKIFPGPNSTTWAIDGGNHVWSFADYPTNKWTEQTQYGSVYDLQWAGDGHLYVLYNNGNCPLNEGYSVGQWNGSGYNLVSYCMTQLSAAVSGGGLVMTLDPNGTPWWFANYWGSPQHAPTPSGGTFPYISLVALSGAGQTSADSYILVDHNYNLWLTTNGGTSFTQLPGSATFVTASSPTTYYAIGYPSQSVFHFNGTSWDSYGGTASYISAAGSFNIWAIGTTGSGNNVYRLAEQSWQYALNVSGTASCTGCTHTINVHAAWQGHSSGDGGQGWKGSPNGVHTNMTSVSTIFDPFDCLEQNAPCTPIEASNNVECSEAGPLNDGGGSAPAPSYVLATAAGNRTSGPPDKINNYWQYPMKDDCIAPGTNIINIGVNTSSEVQDTAPPADAFSWDLQTFCLGSGSSYLCPFVGAAWTRPGNVTGSYSFTRSAQVCTN